MTHVPPNPYCVISSPSSFLPAWFAGESKASIDKTAKEEFSQCAKKTDEWSHDCTLAKQQPNRRWKCVYYMPNQPLMICEAYSQPSGSIMICQMITPPQKRIDVPTEDKDVLWKTTAQPALKRYS